MTIGFLFWLLMIIWLIFGIFRASKQAVTVAIGGEVLLFILLFLLGWKVFGFILQG